jgi:hypothetical protein
MTTTFKKRQKEMKRQDKARSKAEKRLQKKLEPGSEIGNDGIAWEDGVGSPEGIADRARLDLEAFDEALKAETQQ